jgi:hypothetical protein
VINRHHPDRGVMKQPIMELARRDMDGFPLLRTLPDMHSILSQLNLETGLCRGSCSWDAVMNAPQGDGEGETIHLSARFILNGLNETVAGRLAEEYRTRNPEIQVAINLGSHLCLTWSVRERVGEEPRRGYLPDMVNDVHGQLYYVLCPDDCVVEPAAYFVLLFSLGMLARYYPDVWMAVIDKNARVAEVTDAFLNAAYRKFPNLILDQMRDTLHIFQAGSWQQ